MEASVSGDTSTPPSPSCRTLALLQEALGALGHPHSSSPGLCTHSSCLKYLYCSFPEPGRCGREAGQQECGEAMDDSIQHTGAHQSEQPHVAQPMGTWRARLCSPPAWPAPCALVTPVTVWLLLPPLAVWLLPSHNHSDTPGNVFQPHSGFKQARTSFLLRTRS
jgi:hypothetical protein